MVNYESVIQLPATDTSGRTRNDISGCTRTSIADVARSLGVSDRTLWYWVSEERKSRQRAEDPSSLNADDVAELKRLRRENAQQREDMEILRKAAAYFAKETLR